MHEDPEILTAVADSASPASRPWKSTLRLGLAACQQLTQHDHDLTLEVEWAGSLWTTPWIATASKDLFRCPPARKSRKANQAALTSLCWRPLTINPKAWLDPSASAKRFATAIR